tara:strand:- start:30327 stop:30980 length:654 start_codon:yes stop_codon:yes gene_type:complete
MPHLIAPSMLAADFSNLKSEVNMINNSEADWLHLDIMDGLFVPNISFGIPVVKAIKKHTQKPLDVHLMIEKPDRYIQEFKEAGANILTIHFEACNHLHRTIETIKNENMQAGIAINPHTPIHAIEEVLNNVDLICVMSVNPGFGGQSFIENTYQKIKILKEKKDALQSQFLIEVDGGVNQKNATKLIEKGADILVAGSSVFKSDNPRKAISDLKKLI